ncbi:MAG TPA: CDP-glucose 4,6-dehydratase [Candidatus Ozemobacteraceae bacterium]
MFNDIYRGRKVLVTGHTGFKGSWLTAWLLHLGAEVAGYAIDVPSTPAMFEILELGKRIHHHQGDVRDRAALAAVVREFQPEIVFHLAAQALVRKSYADPAYTFETNGLGTLNMLECMRQTGSVKAAVMITSDKCYRNQEWTWGYRETDLLGGDDPYSASKGCAEIIAHSYFHSFFRPNGGPMAATTRAGNVIGGGDWALDRIVPDCIRAWSQGQPVTVRQPEATRPWQHVLEPLSGYLWTGALLWEKRPRACFEAFNFGPPATVNQSVGELITEMALHWPGGRMFVDRPPGAPPECNLLKLCCDKALSHLAWQPTLTFSETVGLTAEWYRRFYAAERSNMFEFTMNQIEQYISIARERRQTWLA